MELFYFYSTFHPFHVALNKGFCKLLLNLSVKFNILFF